MCNEHCLVCLPSSSFFPPYLSPPFLSSFLYSLLPCMHDLLHAIISISEYSEFAQKKCTSSFHPTLLFFSSVPYLTVSSCIVPYCSVLNFRIFISSIRFIPIFFHTTIQHTNTRTYVRTPSATSLTVTAR